MTWRVTVITRDPGPGAITRSRPAPGMRHTQHRVQMTIHATCQELRHQDYDPRCLMPYISQLWLKVVEHRIVPQKADSEECRDKGAAMTTGSSQQFHDFKIYNCSSKYTFSLVRLIYYQVKSSIYLEICLFSSFYLLLTPERSRGIVSVATYSIVTTT